MHLLLYLLYVAIVGFIRIYKWIELRILLLFTPLLKHKAKKLAESIGVIFHCPEDKGVNPDLQDALDKKGKYKRLLHIKVNDNTIFAIWANLGSLGWGETYMEKKWEFCHNNVDDMTELVVRALENNLMDIYYNPWNRLLSWLELHAFNLQGRKRAFQVVQQHYDVGNDLFESMLDPWMQYTCGYWKDAKNLNEAQIDKMELIAKKLDLKPGMRVLDIGCGWGALCKYLAEKHKVECVGITISKEGAVYAKKICDGLPVEIRLQDYRNLNEKFDRIVSVGLFEHIGHWNYRKYFQVVEKCLVDNGIFLLHTIGRNHYRQTPRSDPWIEKYIYPNGQIPLPGEIIDGTKNLFIIEDWHNFSLDYANTLLSWRDNFIKYWAGIQEKFGGDLAFRKWICFLSVSRALFLTRRCQLWQIVLTKDGLKREYRAAR